MFEITVDKLPGGDLSRRRCVARVTITKNEGGVGGRAGVRVYDVRLEMDEPERAGDVVRRRCSTYREQDESVLRLVHRALGRLLGDANAESGTDAGEG